MAIRRVPRDYGAIADAIDAAVDGDRVVVGAAYAGGETVVQVDQDELTIDLSASVTNLTVQLASGLGDAKLTLAGDADARLYGNSGANVLIGNDGDNVIRGGAGSDQLDGGGGLDWADYLDADGSVTVDLAAGTAAGAAGSDTLFRIEGIRGSNSADTLLGDGADNWFRGLEGNDLIDGRGGFDYVDYSQASSGVTVNLAKSVARGEGRDTLTGIENVRGSDHADVLIGDEVENRFRGLGGDDRINGAGGLDYVDYRNATDFVTVDLSRSMAKGSSEGTDTLKSIEKVIGSEFDDVLIGSKGDNLLRGVGGHDTLTGGEGHDSFVFSSPSDGDGRGDRIMDFVSATAAAAGPELSNDIILFDNVGFGVAEGNLAAAGVSFVTDGVPASENATLIYNTEKNTLSWDPDGSGAEKSVRLAVFKNGPSLTDDDFLFI